MKVRELYDAHQWQPGDDHEAVSTTVLESGMSETIHPDAAKRLREGRGHVGWVWNRSSFGRLEGSIVEAGNWIVNRGSDSWEVFTDTEFRKRFEAVPNHPATSSYSITAEA